MRLFVRFPVLDGHFLSMGEHVRKIRMIEIISFCMKGLINGGSISLQISAKAFQILVMFSLSLPS